MRSIRLQLTGRLFLVLNEAVFLKCRVDLSLLVILFFQNFLVSIGMRPASGEISLEIDTFDLAELLEVLDDVFFRQLLQL